MNTAPQPKPPAQRWPAAPARVRRTKGVLLPARARGRRTDDPQDHEQHQRADEGDQDRSGDAAPRDVDVQAAEDEAADESADDADDDVTERTVAAARHG